MFIYLFVFQYIRDIIEYESPRYFTKHIPLHEEWGRRALM